MNISKATYLSPVGLLTLATVGDRLLSLDYEGFEDRFELLLWKRFPKVQLISKSIVVRPIRIALDRYFAGEIGAVDHLAVEYMGTAFENRVWQSLRGIKAGATATYGKLASDLGVPNGARAVGRANSMNPIAIVVPCHRVIGANAALTGYAGGLERKQWLLDHERRWA